MDRLLQCVEKSEDVGDVGRTPAIWRIFKNKQSACTARGSTMRGQAKCPKGIKGVKVSMIRAEKRSSYTKAVKRVERNNEMVAVQKKPEQKRKGAEQNICMDKKSLLALSVVLLKCRGSQKGLRWCWVLPGDS